MWLYFMAVREKKAEYAFYRNKSWIYNAFYRSLVKKALHFIGVWLIIYIFAGVNVNTLTYESNHQPVSWVSRVSLRIFGVDWRYSVEKSMSYILWIFHYCLTFANVKTKSLWMKYRWFRVWYTRYEVKKWCWIPTLQNYTWLRQKTSRGLFGQT